jgi:hypothetical protein
VSASGRIVLDGRFDAVTKRIRLAGSNDSTKTLSAVLGESGDEPV